MPVMSRHAEAIGELLKRIGGIDYFAEIGIWKGHFCRYMFRNYSELIHKKYFAIDQWEILDSRHRHMSKTTKEQWDLLYWRSCLDMMYFDKLHTMRLSSEKASTIFPKEYFDCIFIDASHFYEDVLKDIQLWLPKVKKGGYLTGHDIDSKRHPEVTKAVNHVFGNKYEKVLERAHIWIKKV